ncbi:hypothetical protein Poly51_61240 [Rubripirellula tenax]|uniref:Uncharacterized protein n=1 Tax=Rubripirellula tenax TaxID=2528015 RepID=A0A5C6E6H3_9BACT|nr:hypothetical protein Poly51_61240 [Rubripirellula tenax]
MSPTASVIQRVANRKRRNNTMHHSLLVVASCQPQLNTKITPTANSNEIVRKRGDRQRSAMKPMPVIGNAGSPTPELTLA